MKLTLQSEDVRRFRRLASTLIARPTNTMVQFVEHRGKLAMTIGWCGWMLVVPVRGRKLVKSFKIPLRPLWDACQRADGKMTVNIDTKKGWGVVEWFESCGWRGSHPFVFGLYNFVTTAVPAEPSSMQTLPTSLLGPLAKCSEIGTKTPYPSLAYVRITPDGEFGVTDGKQMLLLQTTVTFPWEENVLVRACDLYRLRMREFKDRTTFKLGVQDGLACFDFGDCRFSTQPDVERYPNLHRILPEDDDAGTRLSIHPKDAAFLKKHLADLSGRKDRHSPVTLLCDYDGTVSVHGTTGDPEKTRAVLLARSSFRGDAYFVQTNRKHLRLVLSLGCLEFRFGSKYPLGFKENVRYCWMPVEGDASVLPLESERPMKPMILLRSDQTSTTKE